jgi:hypothetical protein
MNDDTQDFTVGEAPPTTFAAPDYQHQQKLAARRRKFADDMVSDAQARIDAGANGRMVGPYWIAHDDRNDLLKQVTGAGLNFGNDMQDQTEKSELEAVRSELLARMDPQQRMQAEAKNAGLAFTPNAPAKAPEGFTLSEGQQRFGPDGKSIASVAPKPEKAEASPQSVREYQFAQLEGYKGSYAEWLKDKTQATTRVHVAAAPRDRFQIVTDADGTQHRLNMDTLEKTPIGVNKPANLNEAQGNALLFGTRAQAAHQVLDEIGTDYSSMKTAIARSAENVPGVNAGANAMLSGNEQRVIQAQRDFVNALLRKESGAAIQQSEFNNATKQYFPQVGDTPEVIAQKKANRELAIKGMKAIAGRGATGSFDEVPPSAPKAPQPKTIVREVKLKDGRTGVEYSDGTRGFK